MSKKFLVVPNKDIKGVLPRNKRIDEPTILEDLNQNDIIKCLNQGNVYMDVNGEWVHISSYQDTIDEKKENDDHTTILQQPHDMKGRIVNAAKYTTVLNRPVKTDINDILKKKDSSSVKVDIVEERKDGSAPDIESILNEFDKVAELTKTISSDEEEQVKEAKDEISNILPYNNSNNRSQNYNNNHNRRHNNNKRR